MSLQYGAEETPLAGSYGAADSFPKDFGYGVEEEEEEAAAAGGGVGAGAGGGCGPGGADSSKPRILLMGLRRSGKSSIQKVVFHKMSPNETLFLESTNKIYKDDISNSSFVNFQIWDFPGQMDFFDPTFDYEMIFRGTGALIYVIDAQDDYMEALTRLHITVSKAYKVNPDMNFEVFIHKVDGLSDDHKIETQRDIHQRANDDLADAGLEKLHLSFYLTSIYDHSIFEAFSKVVQKLIPQLPTLENLLNIFISNSGIEKAFLFDVVSKIYIATDSSPVDMQSYELCCDMIDVVIDVSCIYGLKEDGSGSAYDKESMAIIKLNNTTVLYLKEVTKFLALVCILREESFERKAEGFWPSGSQTANHRCEQIGKKNTSHLSEAVFGAVQGASVGSQRWNLFPHSLILNWTYDSLRPAGHLGRKGAPAWSLATLYSYSWTPAPAM
ncbi:ras-related GTP-binding protein C isoform 2-T2 [Callospermophilus lateralis]|uniref:ras-related GTP-binding protein C isoform X2 n=1 Tax=Callospermophilus lateralis TaxID=76772 RepID=UPI004038DE20